MGETSGYFLYADNEKNITISGEGRVDGQGRLRFEEDGADGGYGECPLNVTGDRPRTSFFENIENLTVRNITFYDAAFWTLHMAGCKNVLIDGIRILNNDRGPNNDGIDPDCCQNVVIQNCFIESGDDSIVVKATKSMYEKYGDCENIIIKGCILHSRRFCFENRHRDMGKYPSGNNERLYYKRLFQGSWNMVQRRRDNFGYLYSSYYGKYETIRRLSSKELCTQMVGKRRTHFYFCYKKKRWG